MLNRSAVLVGHEPAFLDWLRSTGITEQVIHDRNQTAEWSIYLIPACHYPEEADEVLEDLFEEVFRRELRGWQPDETKWPDTADFALFTRWFTVECFSVVEDVGHGPVLEER